MNFDNFQVITKEEMEQLARQTGTSASDVARELCCWVSMGNFDKPIENFKQHYLESISMGD